jgi:F-type H+-transporting ATPase subunit a
MLYNFCTSVAGEKNGRQFFPAVATIFLMVIFNSWLSLIPGYASILVHTAEGEHELLRGANTDINMPLALAISSFCIVGFFGIKLNGMSYIGQFINFAPLFRSIKGLFQRKAGFIDIFTGLIEVIIGILEFISQCVRIISFTFRLFGNMIAGEILLLIVTFLMPWLLAIPFYGLEVLVGFIQALIFGGLTLVFLTVAAMPHEAEH